MQHQLLERHSPLRHDEEPNGLATGDERLLDGPAARHQLLALGERHRWVGDARRTRLRVPDGTSERRAAGT